MRYCFVEYFLYQFLLLPICGVVSLRYNFHVTHGTSLIGPIGESFGFNNNGQYNIVVKNYEMYSETTKSLKESHEQQQQLSIDDLQSKYKSGFALQKFKNEAAFNHYMEILYVNRSICSFDYYLDHDDLLPTDDDYYKNMKPVSDHGISLLIESASGWKPNQPTLQYSFDKVDEGLYFLIYQVCPYNPTITSSFQLEINCTNVDAFGNISYLSSGLIHLPLLYFGFSISYGICLLFWCYNILEIIRGKGSIFDHPKNDNNNVPDDDTTNPVLYTIHYLMAILLLFKFLTLVSGGFFYYKMQVTGHAEFLSFIMNTLELLKGLLLFTVILLIGSGWSIIKPYLNPSEKAIFVLLLFFQFGNNLARIIVSKETVGESNYDLWSGLTHAFDIICCCAILVPVMWHINELSKRLEHNVDVNPEDDHEEATIMNTNFLILKRFKTFRLFFLLLVAYVYSTRVLVYLFISMLNYKHTWIHFCVVEMVTLTFYVTVGFLFRPKSESIIFNRVNTQELQDGILIELISDKGS